QRSLAETWPGTPVSVEDVSKRTKFVLYVMAIAAPDFYQGEVCAEALTLDLLRSELFGTLYQRLGVQLAKRSKELSRVFSPEFMADFAATYTRDGEAALDPA